MYAMADPPASPVADADVEFGSSEKHPLAVAMDTVHSLASARLAHGLELPDTCGEQEHFFSGNADIAVEDEHTYAVEAGRTRTWFEALSETSHWVLGTISSRFPFGYGVEDSLDDDDEAARRQLSNPGVVMRKPWKCKAGVNPCGGVSSRAGWGRNAWWKDIRSSGEGRAFTDDGSPVPQVRTGALDGKWDGWITPAARRRLAETEQPPFADFRTTDLFEEEVVNAAQPPGMRLSVSLGEGRVLEAVTWGSRALMQRSTKDAPIMGFEFDGRFVLSDASVLCSQGDGEAGEVVCAGAGTAPTAAHAASQYRHVHYYPNPADAWEAEIDKHMESLGVGSDFASFAWAVRAAGLGLLLALTFASAAWVGRASMKKGAVDAGADLGLELGA